jgi:hypothetical protein
MSISKLIYYKTFNFLILRIFPFFYFVIQVQIDDGDCTVDPPYLLVFVPELMVEVMPFTIFCQ